MRIRKERFNFTHPQFSVGVTGYGVTSTWARMVELGYVSLLESNNQPSVDIRPMT